MKYTVPIGLLLIACGILALALYAPISFVTGILTSSVVMICIFLGCLLSLAGLLQAIVAQGVGRKVGTFVVSAAGLIVSLVLVYAIWIACGSKSLAPPRDLPAFEGKASTNAAGLAPGVYIFERPNAIFGFPHWGIWIPGRGGMELTGDPLPLLGWRKDFSSPYWHECETEPTGMGVKFSALIPVDPDRVVEEFNKVRGASQYHWEERNNCKTQSLFLLSHASGLPTSEIARYCTSLDASFTTRSYYPLLARDASPGYWITRRTSQFLIHIFWAIVAWAWITSRSK